MNLEKNTDPKIKNYDADSYVVVLRNCKDHNNNSKQLYMMNTEYKSPIMSSLSYNIHILSNYIHSN